jgi:hypothetical protein
MAWDKGGCAKNLGADRHVRFHLQFCFESRFSLNPPDLSMGVGERAVINTFRARWPNHRFEPRRDPVESRGTQGDNATEIPPKGRVMRAS